MNNPSVPTIAVFVIALGVGYVVIFIALGSYFRNAYAEMLKDLRTENRQLKAQVVNLIGRTDVNVVMPTSEPPFPDAYPEAYIVSWDDPTDTDYMTDHWTDNPTTIHPPS